MKLINNKKIIKIILVLICLLSILFYDKLTLHTYLLYDLIKYNKQDNANLYIAPEIGTYSLSDTHCNIDGELVGKHVVYKKISFQIPLYGKSNVNVDNTSNYLLVNYGNAKTISTLISSIDKSFIIPNDMEDIYYSNSDLIVRFNDYTELEKIGYILNFTPAEISYFDTSTNLLFNNISLKVKSGLLPTNTNNIQKIITKNSLIGYIVESELNGLFVISSYIYVYDSGDIYQLNFTKFTKREVTCILNSLTLDDV